MLKHYVEFIFINPLRHKRLEVQERNEKSIVFPEGVAAYRFYDRNEVMADDGELLRGKRKNFSEKKILSISRNCGKCYYGRYSKYWSKH